MTSPEPGEFAVARDGEILRCPWHGWEFNLKTGKSVFNPHDVWVRSYPVAHEGGPEEEEAAAKDRIETYTVTVEDSSKDQRKVLIVEL